MEWTYYGAAHRYAVHPDTDAEQACVQVMQSLRTAGAEDELQVLADRGNRCAFITLLEILVDHNRLEELRALARAGDDRALVTLMELHITQGHEAELREDAVTLGRIGWLLDHLQATGRAEEALAELEAWLDTHPKDLPGLQAARVNLVLALGRPDEGRRQSQATARMVARRLRRPRPA